MSGHYITVSRLPVPAPPQDASHVSRLPTALGRTSPRKAPTARYAAAAAPGSRQPRSTHGVHGSQSLTPLTVWGIHGAQGASGLAEGCAFIRGESLKLFTPARAQSSSPQASSVETESMVQDSFGPFMVPKAPGATATSDDISAAAVSGVGYKRDSPQ